jgi:hypothetical protein
LTKAIAVEYPFELVPQYRQIQSRFGFLWVHHCPPLDDGPEWARRERLAVDAGAQQSQVMFQDKSVPFHAHLFRESDGLFRVSARDRALYSVELVNEVERVVNGSVSEH